MDAFDDLMLGYALKKLTNVFEEIMEVSKSPSSDKATGVRLSGQLKLQKNYLSGWDV